MLKRSVQLILSGSQLVDHLRSCPGALFKEQAPLATVSDDLSIQNYIFAFYEGERFLVVTAGCCCLLRFLDVAFAL